MFKVTPEGHPRDDSPVCKTTLDVLSVLPAIIIKELHLITWMKGNMTRRCSLYQLITEYWSTSIEIE